MNSLIVLRNTLLKLKKNEISSLMTFLKSNRKESKDKELKSVRLVQLLLRNKKLTSNQIQEKLYGQNNYHAFNKLILRLKDKIYEIMLFNNNISKSAHYGGKRNQAVFDIKKKLLQCEIMYSRGIYFELEKFQNKIIEKAKQFEVYDCLLEALNSKQRYLVFRFGSIGYNTLRYEIEFFVYNQYAATRARQLFNKITSESNFHHSIKSRMLEVNRVIKILKSDYEKTKSATIGYYYYFLEVDRFQNLNDLFSAQKKLNYLITLLNNNPSVYTDNRMGTTLLNLGINQVLMFDLNASIRTARKAIVFFSERSINLDMVQELQFSSQFYLGKFIDAEGLIEELYHASRTTKTPFFYSKRAYLFACLKTIKGEFSQSHELLKEVKEIEKEKEGWNIGVRTLSIINHIELGNPERADDEIEKMKRHITRTMVKKNVRRRDIIIKDIFVLLMKSGYDFKNSLKNSKDLFDLLESNDPELHWQIKSPELIIFHEWFGSKAENRPYNHNAAMLVEKKKYLVRSRKFKSSSTK